MTPTPEPQEHVCGLTGYNGMIDPPCPACEAAKEAWKKRRKPEPQETRQEPTWHEFARMLRLDASGEAGRMSVTRMYQLADKLDALHSFPQEPQKDETGAERENREAHALLDTLGIPRHDDAGHYKLFGRITLLKSEPREPHAALIAEAPIMSKYHGQRGFEVERFITDYEAWREKCRLALKGE